MIESVSVLRRDASLPKEPFKGSLSDNFGVRSKIVYQLGW